ncbi:phenazine antibiotic biosynthesis-like protein [Actinoplanes philippinensis]|uniref:Trans-2,3-dihydro-3-hydroxyanthranilate isomerase n=1 Tax=Actinoplanes philippinensis TaxID=35752 RepID=A0A1I2JJC4_9ACTN|nr:PhzF family phenazine biosynthesis protein [Actinoplanes philippinensis]GIE80164.1 phenazine antibiotic biosynthesis-like protein [Actinoplanes philippinensis]SFF53953.1 trans-2,3-dihydro-3-hydroxyanthranilate isomerase [Actinoplanes philippinensis]
MSTVAYEIVDVFTDRPFAGNPLAVVFGGAELATDQMQALAREFNLSETVFLLPPVTTGATHRVRIFTPTSELPFAGHPSVGSAVTAMRRGLLQPGEVVQECGAGLLPITVTAAGAATLTGATPTLGDPLDPAPLLAAAGLTAADYAGDGVAAPRTAGCGLDWVFLPVRREALARVRVNPRAAEEAGCADLSVFAWSGAEAHARVFSSTWTVDEDPATGSAALALGVWLVAAGWLPPDGLSTYRIHQGVEMKRPSRLECTVTAAAGTAVTTTVTGHVHPVATGAIAVPPFIG